MTRPRRARHAVAALLAVVATASEPGSGTSPALAQSAEPFQTAVSIDGTRFRINGNVTYPGMPAEGLLLNSRMVQAVFDDENPQTVGKWAYPDTGVWDPERNTNEFVAAVPSYAEKGLRALTINLQGGNPVKEFPTGTQAWNVSAYLADGSLKPAWLARLDRAIRACDRAGIVVILGFFYFGQDQRLTDEAAVIKATDNVTDWLLAQGYTNVLVEIDNEAEGYNHAILKPPRVHELIARVETRSNGALKASTSFIGGTIPPEAVIRESEFVLLHGNGQTPDEIRSMVAKVKASPAYQAAPKPIVFNEDSTDLAKMDAAVGAGASWGYHDKGQNNYVDGFQAPPVNWTINTATKQAFFTRVSTLASPALVLSPDALAFSGTPETSPSAQSATVSTSDGKAVAYTVSENAAWLSVDAPSGQTPATLTAAVDTTGLAPGSYTTDLVATADGYTADKIAVTLTVRSITSPYDVLMSTSSNRSSPTPLAGKTVSGNIYVFTKPDSGVYRVRFYLDDPQMQRTPRRIEGTAPYDFAGGTSTGANPFDTRTIANGSHTITAAVELSAGGTDVLNATFTVANGTSVPPTGGTGSTSGSWTSKQRVPAAVLNAGGTTLEGKLYFVAGRTSAGRRKTMYVYDPVANTWASAASLPAAYPAVERPAVAASGGKLYVFGGSTGSTSGAVTNAAVFDPATSTWTALAPMPAARAGASAQALNGKIYVAGGLDRNGASLSSVAVYDPGSNTWSSSASMPTRRDGFGSAVLDGKLYVFGGRTRNADGSTPSSKLSKVEAYDPATNTWTARASMPTARRGLAVGTLNGRAQVIGGEKSSTSAGTFAHNEEYDPATNTWRSLTRMLTARQGAVAGTIDGVVYVVGGGPTSGSSYSDKNEAFSL